MHRQQFFSEEREATARHARWFGSRIVADDRHPTAGGACPHVVPSTLREIHT